MFDTDFILQTLQNGSEQLVPYFYCSDTFSLLGSILLNYSDYAVDSPENEHEFIVKICIDGGAGFLKVSAQILKATDEKQGPPIILALGDLKGVVLAEKTRMSAVEHFQRLHFMLINI